MFGTLLKRSFLATALALAACSTVFAADTTFYRQYVRNLVPPGGLAANPNLDTTIQSAAQEKAMIDNPPALAAFVRFPSTPVPRGGYPAVVLVGGHTGIYTISATLSNRGDPAKLSMRSKLWIDYLSSNGYVVYLLDDFGSYGFVTGFPNSSWSKRPAWASAANARPYYIYSALEDLARNFRNVSPRKIYLVGWSNGGTATLSTMSANGAPIPPTMTFTSGFARAMALYPACGLENRYKFKLNYPNTYKVVKPLEIVNADPALDDEVDVTQCTNTLYPFIQSQGAPAMSSVRAGAYHTFDANTSSANAIPGNVNARNYALGRILTFFPR